MGWGVQVHLQYKKSLRMFFFCCFLFIFSSQPILQTSNGLFQRKLIIVQGSRGGSTLFQGVGHPTFFQGVGGGPIAYSIKEPI